MQGLKGVRIALRLQNILPSGEDPSGQLSKTERPNERAEAAATETAEEGAAQ